MRRLVTTAVVLAVLVVGALLVAGRGGGSSEEEQLAHDLEADYDMEPERAECVADQLYERFSAGEIDAIRDAEGDRDRLSDELLVKLQAALTPCASAGS